MKKILLIIISLAFIINNISAVTTDIIGQWLMTKAVFNGNTDEVYQTLNFRDDGSAYIQGRGFGSWKTNSKDNTVTIESEMIDEFAGTWKISKSTESKMTLGSKDGSLFFTRYNPEEIENNNKNSGLKGVWKLNNKDEDDADILLYFKAPDKLLVHYTGYGYTGKGSGIWIHNKKENSVILIVQDRLLRGRNDIVSITNGEFILKNKGIKITGYKLEQNGKTREQLPLVENDNKLTTNIQNDETTGLNRENFSWFNIEAKNSYLKDVTTLKYKKSTLLDNFDVFITENLSADVSFDEYNGTIEIDDIFDELPGSDDYEENAFYPLEEPFEYTVVGEKDITVPAGTYKCTVIDINDTFEGSRTRLYMINNRPGVYAKIITVKKEFDDETYNMYELTRIGGNFSTRNNKQIEGSWLLTELTSNGEKNKMSRDFDFINDGRLGLMQSGSINYFKWNYKADENKVALDFGDGEQNLNIETLTMSKMILKNNELTYSFIKMKTESTTPGKEDYLLTGYWMLTNTQNPYSLIHLTDDHSVYDIERISSSPIEENYAARQGKWMYDSSNKTLVFNTDEDDAICYGSFGVRKLKETLMVLDDQGYHRAFVKIDPDKIRNNNAESGLEGLWKIKGQNGTYNYYDFRDLLLFRKGLSEDDMPKTGLWVYNPKDKTLFMGYQMHQLEGSNVITKITEKTIIFDNGLTAEKVK